MLQGLALGLQIADEPRDLAHALERCLRRAIPRRLRRLAGVARQRRNQLAAEEVLFCREQRIALLLCVGLDQILGEDVDSGRPVEQFPVAVLRYEGQAPERRGAQGKGRTTRNGRERCPVAFCAHSDIHPFGGARGRT